MRITAASTSFLADTVSTVLRYTGAGPSAGDVLQDAAQLGELVLVTAVDSAAGAATVQRGFLSSTAVAHLAGATWGVVAHMAIGTVAPTLYDLRVDINRELKNYIFALNYADEGDGATAAYTLPHTGVIPGSETVILTRTITSCADGSTATVADIQESDEDYTIDNASGVIIFTNPPSAELDVVPTTGTQTGTDGHSSDAIQVIYQAQMWDDIDINNAVNAAIQYVYATFNEDDCDDSITVNPQTLEYELPDSVGYVRRIEIQSNDTPELGFTPIKSEWEVREAGGNKYIRFFTQARGMVPLYWMYPMTTGTMRVCHMPDPGTLQNDPDGLSVVGHVQNKARYPIVLYAAYHILNMVVLAKAKDNAFLNAQGANFTTVGDLQRAALNFMTMCDKTMTELHTTPHIHRW